MAKAIVICDLNSGACSESGNIGGNSLALDIESLVGAECRQNPDIKARSLDLFVEMQVIGGVIGGAKQLNTRCFDVILCAKAVFCQLFGGDIPYFFSVFCIDSQFTVKISAKLQMTPMIDGISNQKRHNTAVFAEFFKV